MYSGFEIPDGCTIHNLLLQHKRKFRSFPISALYLQSAAQQLQKLDCDIHAQPAAFNIAVPVLFNPLKFRRQPGQILRFNPYACVFHFECKEYRLIRLTASDTQPDGALMGIFDRIG